ncbi:LacI family transcriptional regulator [candidate division KSB1 bacterium]|nr:MAG: LacI family transcriptional regulator [candidate division KSB1 bacterium]
MRDTQITLKDIAKKLKVSTSTVSRALRHHPDISQETREKVEALAKKLDYHPDSIAQSLKKRRTNTIGVIVPEIKHDFFSSALNGIEDIAYSAGFTIIVCKSNEDYEREKINTHVLISNRIAGLVASVSQTTKNSEHFKLLQRRNIPVVFFDRVCDDIDATKVIVDDYGGALTAVEFLIKKGYKRIAHIGGPEYLSLSRKRLKGYLNAHKRHNIQPDESLIIKGGMNEEDGVIGAKRLFKSLNRPDAIFAVNDPVAIGVYMAARESGIKIPDDIGVVGFSDNAIVSLIDPPLTTVSQPAYEMGVTAAKMLLDEINNPEKDRRHKIKTLRTKLIIRDSA